MSGPEAVQNRQVSLYCPSAEYTWLDWNGKRLYLCMNYKSFYHFYHFRSTLFMRDTVKLFSGTSNAIV